MHALIDSPQVIAVVLPTTRGQQLRYHPEYATECPWFEHTETGLTSNGQQHCPYANPDASEQQLARRLQSLLPDDTPMVTKADWHYTQCAIDYHDERYCLICRTGNFSHRTTVAA
ncbi:DUF7828 domain-containing protein [Pseudocitrobacter corydidari]